MHFDVVGDDAVPVAVGHLVAEGMAPGVADIEALFAIGFDVLGLLLLLPLLFGGGDDGVHVNLAGERDLVVFGRGLLTGGEFLAISDRRGAVAGEDLVKHGSTADDPGLFLHDGGLLCVGRAGVVAVVVAVGFQGGADGGDERDGVLLAALVDGELHGHKAEGGEHGDDGNHREQFDEGEAPAAG